MHTARKNGERYQKRKREGARGRAGDGGEAARGECANVILNPILPRPLALSPYPPAIIPRTTKGTGEAHALPFATSRDTTVARLE